jgi:hypothetical protein
MDLPELAIATVATAEDVSSMSDTCMNDASEVSLTNLCADEAVLVSRADERNSLAAICLSLDSAAAAYKARRSPFRFGA